MAHVYNSFNQTNLYDADNTLNLVNERLLGQASQQRTSELQIYFQGYREFVEEPPSPTLSDPDQLFSYLEQSSTSLDCVAPSSPSCGGGPQKNSEVASHGKTAIRQRHLKANPSKNQPTLPEQNHPSIISPNTVQQVMEINRTDVNDIQGVKLSKLARFQKHTHKALTAWKHGRAEG